MASDDIMERIRAKREQQRQASSELTALVEEAFATGHTWQELADCLGVTKGRVYQIKAGTR